MRCLNLARLACILPALFQTACLVEFPMSTPENTTDTVDRGTETVDTASNSSTGPETDSDSDTCTDTRGDSETETTDTTRETGTSSFGVGPPDGGADGGEETDRGTDTDSETGTGTEVTTGGDTGTDSETDTGTDSATETESETDTGSAIDTGTDTDTHTGTGIDTGTGADTDTGSEITLGPGQDDALRVDPPPTIDGILKEALWQLETPVGKSVSGGLPNNTAFFDAVWDESYLYVAVVVTDTVDCDALDASVESWWNDSAEIYLNVGNETMENCDYNINPCYDQNDYQIVIKWRDNRTGPSLDLVDDTFPDRAFGDSTKNRYLAYQATGFWTKNDDGDYTGYTIEARIPWTGLGVEPNAGLTMGFDIGVNDDDAPCSYLNNLDATRDGELRWNGTSDNYRTTEAFGELVLFNRHAN
jgi:hypothetical protein